MSDLLVQRSDVSEFRRRYKYFTAIVALAFIVIIVRLFQLQVLEGKEYSELAHGNIVHRTELPTTRGVIRDGQGRPLASSRPSHNVIVVPGRVMPSARPLHRGQPASDDPDTWPKVADALRLNPEERSRFEKRIRDACLDDSIGAPGRKQPASPCWRPLLVKEDLARDIVAEVKQHAAELAGAEVVTVPVRYYPYKSLGVHLLGYVGLLDERTLTKVRPPGYDTMSADDKAKVNPLAYEPADSLGVTGVEKAWESYLRGQRGWEKRVVDAHGRFRKGPEADRLLDDPKRQEPIPGRDLRLTIDIELMQSIERSLRPYAAGAAVVLEVRTGRVLALYSKPEFDPNDLSGAGGKARIRQTFERLSTDPLKPMLDRTMSGAFQPGSTFKPFAALAALEEKLVDPEDRERCDGYLLFGKRMFHCTHVHGRVNMRDAIAASCNVFFFKLAEAVGMDRMAKLASDFGLGEKTGLGVNPEAPGRVPTRSWYALRYRGQFRIGFTLNTAIGQGDSLVTPLQLGLAYGALANGGTVYSPQIVRAVETGDGTIVQDFPPRVRHKAQIHSENLARITDALGAVVADPRGTAFPVRDITVDLAGKTGTAQTGYIPTKQDDAKRAAYFSRDHAWFAAFAPSKAPEIAVIVFIEHGGSGPTQAAPLAIQIVKEYNRLQQTRPRGKPILSVPKPTGSTEPPPPFPVDIPSAFLDDAGSFPLTIPPFDMNPPDASDASEPAP